MGRDNEKYHKRNHNQYVHMDECWRCQRAEAICWSKVFYATGSEAARAADTINEENDWERPLIGYNCSWCHGYHLTTAEKWKGRKRKAEKRRRRIINLKLRGEWDNGA